MDTSKIHSEVNPLTGLPGNREIKEKLKTTIGDSEKIVVYIDITDFKPYNEVYGFTAGDNVILSTSELLKKALDEVCEGYLFLGHVGGDDFIIVTGEKYLNELFTVIDREFLLMRRSFYNQCDISRKFIIGWDRKGERARFMLMGICAVAFSSYRQGFNTVEQISEYATYLKESSKSRRTKDNIFITPEKLNILPVPLRDFILDENIPLFKRRTVVEAMGESGFMHYGDILISVLKEPVNMLLKKSILFSIGRLRYNKAEELLIEFTKHENPHLRTRAVEALGNIGGVKHLVKIGAMVYDPNPYVSVMAIKSLGNIGHRNGLKYLRDVSSGFTGRRRLEAVVTRCAMGDTGVTEELNKLIADINPLIRKRSAAAMELMPSVDAVKILYEAIRIEKFPKIKEVLIVSFGNVAKALPEKDFNKITSYVWKVYKISTLSIRPYLLPAIGKIKMKNIRKILRKYFRSSSSFERYYAVEGLAEYSDPEQVFLIRKGLKDSKSVVRAKSAALLGNLMDIEGMEFLRRSLKDSDELVRKKAAEAIIKMTADNSRIVMHKNSE